MGRTCGPARRLAFLRGDAGHAHAFALRQLERAVAGKPHGREQGVAETLRAAVVLALAVEQFDAVLRRVLAGRVRNLVDHAFDGPEGPAGSHRTQLARRRGFMRHLVLDRPDIVVRHGIEEVRTVHGEGVKRALLVDRRRQEIGDSPALGRPGRHHVMTERDQLAVAVEPRLDLLIGERTREIHRHVVLARVDHLDRLADGFRRLHRRYRHVAIETPAETAAQIHLMHHHMLGIDPGRAGCDRARAGRELVAGIDVQDVALELRCGVHRLHRAMDVDVGGVFCLDHLRRGAQCGRRIAILDEELSGIAEALQTLRLVEQ